MKFSLLFIMLALATFFGAMIGAYAHWTESRLWGNVLFIIAFITLIGAGISNYDDNRKWDLTEEQISELKKFACNHENKFPFFVFDLGSVPETNTYAMHLRDMVFKPCKWTGVQLYHDDPYLPQNIVGIEVVWSPESENEEYRSRAKLLSAALTAAGVDHKTGPHTRLVKTLTKIGIVVGGRPGLWEHFSVMARSIYLSLKIEK